MRRRIIIVVIFLLAGAVVNVAVAWVCVIRPASIDAGLYGWRDYAVQLDPDDREWIEWWADRAPPGYAPAPNVAMFVAEELGFSSLVAVANRFDNVDQLHQRVTRLRKRSASAVDGGCVLDIGLGRSAVPDRHLRRGSQAAVGRSTVTVTDRR